MEIFISEKKSRGIAIAFYKRKECQKPVKHFKAISDSLCYIKIKDNYKDMKIVNIQASTEEKEEEVKYKYFEVLNIVTDSILNQGSYRRITGRKANIT